jgi:type II secretory pathway pseudopilin PulG
MRSQRLRRGNGERRDSGYMLLVLMLAVAVLTITLLQVSMNYRRSIVRDREVEMIHRGVQYERAIRVYYRKVGSYPTSIEQLENTNKIRFLRKRYKDPMSPDGQWQIAHITDIKLTGSGLTALTAATGPGGAGAANQAQTITGGLGGAPTPATRSTDSSNPAAATGSTGGQTTGTTTGNGPADTNGASGNGAGPVLGGGPMLGVISKSKAEGMHSFNDKSHYNEWYFIYDPSQDKGQQLTGPYNPNLTLGVTTTTGTPAGQPGTPPATPPVPTPATPPAP